MSPVEIEIEKLLSQLTLAEKLHLMDGDPDFWSGMWALMAQDSYHHRPFTAGKVPRLGLRGLRFVDGPRGVVLAGGATTFPVTMARGAAWDARTSALHWSSHGEALSCDVP